MSGIARVLRGHGRTVSGCDRSPAAVEELRAEGIDAYVGHDPAHLRPGMELIVSTAVEESEPELAAARRQGLRVRHRSDVLADIVASGEGICVAGAHGKTSTTALIAYVLEQCGEDPTYLVGGVVPQLGSNARVGRGATSWPRRTSRTARSRACVHGPRSCSTPSSTTTTTSHRSTTCTRCSGRGSPSCRARGCSCCTSRSTTRPNARSAATGQGRGRVGAHSTSSRTGMARASCSPHRVAIRCRCGSACPARTTRSTPRPRSPCSTGPVSLPSAPRPRWPSSAAPRAATSAGERSPGSASSTTTRTIRANWPPRSPPRAARPRPDGSWPASSRTCRGVRAEFADGFAEALRLADAACVCDVYVARGAADPAVTGELVVESARRQDPAFPIAWTPGYADAADWIVRTARPGDLVLTLGAGPVDSVLGLVRERL